MLSLFLHFAIGWNETSAAAFNFAGPVCETPTQHNWRPRDRGTAAEGETAWQAGRRPDILPQVQRGRQVQVAGGPFQSCLTGRPRGRRPWVQVADAWSNKSVKGRDGEPGFWLPDRF